MNAGDRGAAPRFAAAAREQFRDVMLTFRSRRSMIVSGVLLVGTLVVAIRDGFPAFVISDQPGAENGLQFIRPAGTQVVAGSFGLALAFAAALVVGFLWPFRVWRDNRPGQRDYFWSLPVDTRVHELLRVAAGLAGLQLFVLALLCTALVGAVSTWGLAAAASVPARAWASFLVGPAIFYLLNSIATLRTERPALWLLGLYYPLGLVLLVVSVARRGTALGGWARQLADGPFSLYATTLGPFVNHVAAPHYQVPTSSWAVAAALWIALGGLGVVAAAVFRRYR